MFSQSIFPRLFCVRVQASSSMTFSIDTIFSSSTTNVFLILYLLAIPFIPLRNFFSVALTLLLFLSTRFHGIFLIYYGNVTFTISRWDRLWLAKSWLCRYWWDQERLVLDLGICKLTMSTNLKMNSGKFCRLFSSRVVGGTFIKSIRVSLMTDDSVSQVVIVLGEVKHSGSVAL